MASAPLAGSPLASRPAAGRGAVTVEVAGIAVAAWSEEPAVAHWLRQYMAAFWDVRDGVTRPADAEVIAVADRQERLLLSRLAARSPGAEQVPLFLGAPGVRADSGGRLLAASEAPGIALARSGRQVTVVADDGPELGLATARVVRELAGALLEERGFVLVHAAAAARHGSGLLALGAKGAGKTTAVLSLAATRPGWAVCSNDRCYLGEADGQLCLLPWPSSLNVGVGLAAALGWAEQLRTRYRAGQQPAYRQDPAVTAAVLAGAADPVRAGGRELKVQLLPGQLDGWLGVALGARARPAALAFPRLELAGGRVRAERLAAAPVTASDVFPPAAGTDAYPDVLRLRPGAPDSRAAAALAALRSLAGRLPAYRVVLGRDLAANAALLASLQPNRW